MGDATVVLRVQLLGSFEIELDGRALGAAAWRLRKAQSLVKLLALAPAHRLHREQILDALWPDLDPAAAANNLHFTLHRARRLLDAPASAGLLALADGWLTLAPPGLASVDVDELLAAARAARQRGDPGSYAHAAGLYAGDLLPDDIYEDWAAARREELRGLYLALLEELAQAREAGGDLAGACEALGRLAAHEPAHEAAHAGLMRLYARLGRRSQAISQYQLLQAALRAELGLEPEPATQQLYRELLAGAVDAAAPPPHAARRHNLPAALTSFVGRTRELAEARAALRRGRLLTLAGPGGCGKTRLALALAETALDDFADGVWLAELAPLRAPAELAHAVAAALGVRERADLPLEAGLAEQLAERSALLVLDNCEQLAEACARLAGRLLAAAPGLRIVATSRCPLGLAGEIVRRVPGLEVDGGQAAERGGSAAEGDSLAPAVRLFVERAAAVRPGFALTPASAAAVTEICQHLDGMPLAIELAAARAALLSPDDLLARLSDRFALLTGGSRAAPRRQQTLRAAMDWSYGLLDEPGRALFRRLAVFAGGWGLEAAEVVADLPDTLGGLAHLVDQSLVTADLGAGGEGRYAMLETLRAYALGRLEESGDAARARERHAAYMLALAEAAEPQLTGASQLAWLARLARERDNLRAALDHLRGRSPAEAARLAAALWRFWYVRGDLGEGRAYLESALGEGAAARRKELGSAAGPEEPLPAWVRARVLNGLGMLLWAHGDYGAAVGRLEASLEIHRALGDQAGEAGVLVRLGGVRANTGDYRRALACYEAGLALYRAMGDRGSVASLLGNLGATAQELGDYERARGCLSQSLALQRSLGDSFGAASSLYNLGRLALLQGDLDAAEAALRESLALRRELGGAWNRACCLEGFAAAAAMRGSLERAATLWAAAEALRGSLCAPLPRAEREELERRLAAARAGAEPVRWREAWAAGLALDLEAATDLALGGGTPTR